MKTFHVLLTFALTAPSFFADVSEAAVIGARRTVVAAQGPYGGTVVGASRTAVVRPAYGFLSSTQAVKETSVAKACEANKTLVRVVQNNP